MKTHDPFLRHWLNIIDRTLVWLALSLGCSAVIWSVAFQRGLQQPVVNGWHLFYDILVGGSIDRFSLTLLALSGAAGVMFATLLSVWLVRRWQRQGESSFRHIRGSDFGE